MQHGGALLGFNLARAWSWHYSFIADRWNDLALCRKRWRNGFPSVATNYPAESIVQKAFGEHYPLSSRSHKWAAAVELSADPHRWACLSNGMHLPASWYSSWRNCGPYFEIIDLRPNVKIRGYKCSNCRIQQGDLSVAGCLVFCLRF